MHFGIINRRLNTAQAGNASGSTSAVRNVGPFLDSGAMEANISIQPLTSFCTARVMTGEQLLIIENIKPKFMEVVNIYPKNGKMLRGHIIKVSKNKAVAQVFEDISGLVLNEVRVECTGEVFKMSVSEDMIGGFFDGSGRPRDKTFASYPEKKMEIEGRPINPIARRWPVGVIATGISAIDLMNTITVGFNHAIYSSEGLPHNELVAQIIRQATIMPAAWIHRPFSTEFTIVFAGMGLSHEEVMFFTAEFQHSKNQVTSFINTISDPIHERILTPRLALTFAEYLAFEKQKHVMVVMTDMISYCETMKLAREEYIYKKHQYSIYLSSDLATLFERSGVVEGSGGSVTIVPVVTVPNDDQDHPIVELMVPVAAQCTKLDRAMHNRGVYPPIDLMFISKIPNSTGEGITFRHHRLVAVQLCLFYADALDILNQRSVLSESGLDEMDELKLEFKRKFDERILSQPSNESRDLLSYVVDAAKKLLRMFPKESLLFGFRYFNNFLD